MSPARRGVGLAPFFLITNALVWISAVIVMGIESYWISQNNNQGSHVIYEEVIVRAPPCHAPPQFPPGPR